MIYVIDASGHDEPYKSAILHPIILTATVSMRLTRTITLATGTTMAVLFVRKLCHGRITVVYGRFTNDGDDCTSFSNGSIIVVNVLYGQAHMLSQRAVNSPTRSTLSMNL